MMGVGNGGFSRSATSEDGEIGSMCMGFDTQYLASSTSGSRDNGYQLRCLSE
ncbi:hypothetical protein [uncultured Rikenella sp.]|uniref:hypothetical protein n=2 Tax=uncultured Rikenella sp. TaxID=368003 RepID=UPI00260CEC2A|nr:hypothetical protein [uncultured Rikenella sp.]